MLCQFCLERCDVLDIDIVTQNSFMQGSFVQEL